MDISTRNAAIPCSADTANSAHNAFLLLVFSKTILNMIIQFFGLAFIVFITQTILDWVLGFASLLPRAYCIRFNIVFSLALATVIVIMDYVYSR